MVRSWLHLIRLSGSLIFTREFKYGQIPTAIHSGGKSFNCIELGAR
jgi:hypothetical protein